MDYNIHSYHVNEQTDSIMHVLHAACRIVMYDLPRSACPMRLHITSFSNDGDFIKDGNIAHAGTHFLASQSGLLIIRHSRKEDCHVHCNPGRYLICTNLSSLRSSSMPCFKQILARQQHIATHPLPSKITWAS